MSHRFAPRLEILPPPQRRLWEELAATPEHFTLYGGTAIALRLGHRASADFDFFSANAFEPGTLLAAIPLLAGAAVRQSAANTLTCSVLRGGPVQLSFFGGLSLGEVAPAEVVEGPRFKVASLLDLAGTKVALVTQRAELRDYLDVCALLTQAGIGLPAMLAAASAIYGSQFNPLLSLKALAYHADPGLTGLPAGMCRDLIAAVKAVDLERLPRLAAVRPWSERR